MDLKLLCVSSSSLFLNGNVDFACPISLPPLCLSHSQVFRLTAAMHRPGKDTLHHHSEILDLGLNAIPGWNFWVRGSQLFEDQKGRLRWSLADKN